MSLRAYFLQNMYVAGIHAGIQAAHATHQLFTKYHTPSTHNNVLYDWANNHKTMIVLNGGMNSQMVETVDFFNTVIESVPELSIPWATFCESVEAANGLLTSIAFVVPEKIWNRESFLLEAHGCGATLEPSEYNNAADQLYEIIRSKSLAR